jgi:hypothetical protein
MEGAGATYVFPTLAIGLTSLAGERLKRLVSNIPGPSPLSQLETLLTRVPRAENRGDEYTDGI